MENNLENDSEKVVCTSLTDAKKSMTRRAILLCLLIGGLVVTPFASRFILPKKTLVQEKPTETQITFHDPLTQITFHGPFKMNEVILPAVVPNIIEISGNDIMAESLTFYEGTYNDTVSIIFTFQGKEDANRKLYIFLYVLDDMDNVIAEKHGGSFTDPRIFAREEMKTSGKSLRPSATIHVELKKDVEISSISKIRLISLQDLED